MILGLSVLCVVVLTAVFMLSIYKKCSNNELLIKYGYFKTSRNSSRIS